MPGIPNDVYRRLRETLLECGPFNNDPQLRAVFANASLAPWRSRIPEANNSGDRVEAIIDFLMDKRHSKNQANALVLLLEVLRDRIDPNDTCYEHITNVTEELRNVFQDHVNPPQTSNEPAKAATSFPSTRNSLFICYSHDDKKYLQELQTHLAYYIRKNNLYAWDDTKIPAGGDWKVAIEKALQSTKVALLLISPDFWASDFIDNYELPPLLTAARQGDLTILSVIIRLSSAFEDTELARFHSVNDPSDPLADMTRTKRDEVWIKVAGIVRKTLMEHG